MSEGYFKLEGTDLGDADTDIVVVATERTIEVFVPTEAVRGDTEVWERTGKSLKMLNITFTLLGRGSGKFTWDTFIQAILENNSPILLESPEYDENYRILDTFRRVYIQPTGRISSRIVNASQIDITFSAILLGAPVADGGVFELCASYAVEFLTNDFWAATDSAGYTDTPLLGLPAQASAYPKARSPTTGQMLSLPSTARKKQIIAAGDGVEGLMGLWDLTGYVFGAPHDEGDGGPAYVCESATGTTGDFEYLSVATLRNDFGIAAATAPWLYALASGETIDFEDGPAWTEGTAWSITAAGDGTTGALSVQRITSADGIFIVEEA